MALFTMLAALLPPPMPAEGRRYTQDITDDLNDRTAIQQRVSLLLDNALEYSSEGGEISLTAHPVEKG